MATPAATPWTAARTRVVSCRNSFETRCAVRDGSRQRKTISIQFSSGTKNSRHSHGVRRASNRRRRVIETPIQGNGSVQIASASQNHCGAAGAIRVGWLSSGFR